MVKRNRIVFKYLISTVAIFSVGAPGALSAQNDQAEVSDEALVAPLLLNAATRDNLLSQLRDGNKLSFLVRGVVDLSIFQVPEAWNVDVLTFEEGARLKLGTSSFRLNARKIVAPKDAVIIYTFDDAETPPKQPRAGTGSNGVTPSGDGRNGAHGQNGVNGQEGVAGESGGLLTLVVSEPLDHRIFVDLVGQDGGAGGDGGNGGDGASGNRGRRGSDGPFDCKSGAGDGGRGGNGGTGGNAGIGGKPGDGGLLVVAAPSPELIAISDNVSVRGEAGRPGRPGSGASGGGGGRGSTYCKGGSGGSRGAAGRPGVILEPRYNSEGAMAQEL